jgi:hypothetical protein
MISIYQTIEEADCSEKGFRSSLKGFRSSLKKVALAAAFAVSAGSVAFAADMPTKAPLVKAKPVPFFFVNDNAVSFTYFPNATDPGVAAGANNPGGAPGGGKKNSFARYEVDLTHFDVWEYGTNFIGYFGQQYGSQDPTVLIPGTFGARESDLITNSTLGWNELSHSKMFSNFLTKDISFEYHMFVESETGGIDSETTQFAGGLQFLLNLPGTVALSVWADKEISHGTYAACGPVTPFQSPLVGCAAPFAADSFSGDRYYHVVPKLNLAISEPLTFLPASLPVTWGSTTTVTFPKGTGIGTANLYATCGGGPAAAGFAACLANDESKTEVWEDNRLTLDDGQVFWGKPGIWESYVGYRYWYNKFGTDHNAPLFSTIAPGTSIESTAYIGSTYHFK